MMNTTLTLMIFFNSKLDERRSPADHHQKFLYKTEHLFSPTIVHFPPRRASQFFSFIRKPAFLFFLHLPEYHPPPSTRCFLFFVMDSEATLVAMAFGRRFTDHMLLIGPTILCYDHLLTLRDEVQFVWRKPKRLSFFIFVVLRYVSLLSNIGMLVLRLGPVPLESEVRLNNLIFTGCPVHFVTIGILGLRVYAMYNSSKIVLSFLIATGLATTFLAAWSITGETWVLATQMSGCDYPVSKESAIRMAGAWEAQFFCDLMVFVFTVVRSYKQPFKIPGSILSYMVRDGALYFAVLALVNLGNILMYYLGDPWIASSLSWFTSTLSATMVSRLMLHLHQVADLGVLTEHGAETSLHFKTRHLVHTDEESSVCGED
ncbi:hypothetical protein MVEN_01966200 [Mycena venus]|uniref:DUF6533 domain-containing protein n=1 Tax=Mycena venus TaxID=2733690 RepID=A0A8H6XHI0_9AGAR|nr:hypothetical protein MVEN_01966200 [Mycena venus]